MFLRIVAPSPDAPTVLTTEALPVPFPHSQFSKRPVRKAALASLQRLSILYAPATVGIDPSSPSSSSGNSPTSRKRDLPAPRMNYLLSDSSDSDEFMDDLEPGMSTTKRRGILRKRKRKGDGKKRKVVGIERAKNKDGKDGTKTKRTREGLLGGEDLEIIGVEARRKRQGKGNEKDSMGKKDGNVEERKEIGHIADLRGVYGQMSSPLSTHRQNDKALTWLAIYEGGRAEDSS